MVRGLSVIRLLLELENVRLKDGRKKGAMHAEFIETWLSGLYVDRESASNLIQIVQAKREKNESGWARQGKSVYPGAVDLWRSANRLKKKLSSLPKPTDY